MAPLIALNATRQWLDDSGIWSCRMKIAQPPGKQRRPPSTGFSLSSQMPPSHALDVVFDSSAPRSWRNKEKLEKALQSMTNLYISTENFELPNDPDAQASVADFLDFTEYLPSDMIRSLKLIGHLDQIYCDASANVHNLTVEYGSLPTISPEKRPDSIRLRADISKSLESVINVRTLAHAEACHMNEMVQRHYSRIRSILNKLQTIADNYPPSREASPVTLRAKSPAPALSSAPKITLRMDGSNSGQSRPRKNCPLRITVPGEVLAPYEVDFPSYDDENSEDFEKEEVTPLMNKPNFSMSSQTGPKLKLKLTNRREKKSRKEKAPRPPRAPGAMGTNVHSSVAGISTSNALAQLQPPPPDAKVGDKDLPWLRLNAWELAKLRKRMKKNAIWSPSDTMIARELKSLGRGIEAYRTACLEAEAAGESPSWDEPPQVRGEAVHAEGAISIEALRASDPLIFSRSMHLNEIRKQKKEKELVIAPKEAEEAAQQMAASADAIKGLFNDKNIGMNQPKASASEKKEEKLVEKQTENLVEKQPEKLVENQPEKLVEKQPENPVEKPAENPVDKPAEKSTKKLAEEQAEKLAEKPAEKQAEKQVKRPAPKSPAKASAKKRKREFEVEPSTNNEIESEMIQNTKIPLKKSKSENFSPATVGVISASPSLKPVLLTMSDPPQSGPTVSSSIEVLKIPAISILPPKEAKKPTKRDFKATETAANFRPRRTSVAPISTPSLPPVTDPVSLSKRPTSSRSQKPSVEAGMPSGSATVDRQRRTSNTRTTPAPESRTQNKRNKRPAPGVLTTNSGGSTTVSVGKRSAATRKKPGSKKEKKDGSTTQEVFDEVDDDGNLIDPDEPRYCSCNRVSFGVMIGCEGANCEKEWFHLECVGLLEIPPRTTKWYCPLCRVALGIGEKGEVNARGMKK